MSRFQELSENVRSITGARTSALVREQAIPVSKIAWNNLENAMTDLDRIVVDMLVKFGETGSVDEENIGLLLSRK
jgi:hypothetical protein